MINIPTKTATVKSVYEKFTAELTKVMNQQEQVVTKAAQEQEALKTKMDAAKDRQLNAEKEADLAKSAIKNIGELLGVPAEGSNNEEHF